MLFISVLAPHPGSISRALDSGVGDALYKHVYHIYIYIYIFICDCSNEMSHMSAKFISRKHCINMQR